MLQLSTLRWCPEILCRTICKPGKNLLLLCQLMVGNFPLTSGPTKPTHMLEHCRVVDTQLYSSDNAQFIMCSSDRMVSGGSWLSVQDPVAGLELLLKGLLLLLVEDGRIVSPNPCAVCNSPTGICQRIQTASLSTVNIFSPLGSARSYALLHESYDLPDHMTHVTGQVAQQPGPVAEPSAVLGPLKLAAFWVSQ